MSLLGIHFTLNYLISWHFQMSLPNVLQQQSCQVIISFRVVCVERLQNITCLLSAQCTKQHKVCFLSHLVLLLADTPFFCVLVRFPPC